MRSGHLAHIFGMAGQLAVEGVASLPHVDDGLWGVPPNHWCSQARPPLGSTGSGRQRQIGRSCGQRVCAVTLTHPATLSFGDAEQTSPRAGSAGRGRLGSPGNEGKRDVVALTPLCRVERLEVLLNGGGPLRRIFYGIGCFEDLLNSIEL
jgi:hypothetical protein